MGLILTSGNQKGSPDISVNGGKVKTGRKYQLSFEVLSLRNVQRLGKKYSTATMSDELIKRGRPLRIINLLNVVDPNKYL